MTECKKVADIPERPKPIPEPLKPGWYQVYMAWGAYWVFREFRSDGAWYDEEGRRKDVTYNRVRPVAIGAEVDR